MAAILFLASIVVADQLWATRRRLRSSKLENTVEYFLVENLFEFFAILAIVGVTYGVLATATALDCEFTSTDFLIRLEQGFRTTRDALGPLKNPRIVLTMLAVLLLLRFFGPPFFRAPGWQNTVKLYSTWIKRAYLVAVLLTSFTLLTSQLDDQSGIINIQIRINNEAYTQLRKGIHQSIVRYAARDLLERISNPSGPATALKDLQKQASGQLVASRRAYERASSRPEANVRSIGILLAKYRTSSDEGIRQQVTEASWVEIAPRDISRETLQ